MANFYEVLGVANDAQLDVIKEAYRKLALRYHPDTSEEGPSASHKFLEIQGAWEALRDEHARSAYDKHLLQGTYVNF